MNEENLGNQVKVRPLSKHHITSEYRCANLAGS
jgi:hypothetical protein